MKSPPLLKYEKADKTAEHEAQVEQLKRAAYKSLGEAYLEQTPPAYTRALEMFAKAVPGLPDFSLMLKRSRGNCTTSQKDVPEVPSTDALSDEISAALLKVGPVWYPRHEPECYRLHAFSHEYSGHFVRRKSTLMNVSNGTRLHDPLLHDLLSLWMV